MTSVLDITRRFAARALHEAIARRLGSDDELNTLLETCEAGGARGLDRDGAAFEARVLLDGEVELEPEHPLARIEEGLALGRSERDVLRLLVAWSLEPAIGELIGHLHGDLARDRPSHAALAWTLDPRGVACALAGAGALVRYGVVDKDRSGPDALLALDDRLVAFVASGAMPPLDSDGASLTVVTDRPLDDVDVRRTAHVRGRHVVLWGRHREDAVRAALQIARDEGRALLHLQVGEGGPAGALAIAERDARILGARLLITGPLRRVPEGVPLCVVLEDDERLPTALREVPLARVELAALGVAERRRLWASYTDLDAGDERVLWASERYTFGAEEIRRAATQFDGDDIDRACRLQADEHRRTFGERRMRNVGWDRIVLPDPAVDALRTMCAQVERREQVDEAWGFARHHQLGRGVKSLFYGPSGTGKTLAAEVVATTLGLPLLRIDTAKIVSKWVGESERALSRLFDEVERAPAVLVFDEADSLFGKRTSIGTATDRYANMEVNYLLQRLDEYPGVAVLTTNMKSNIDEAFLRRLHHVVEFPAPDLAARERIWSITFPPEAPVDADVDVQVLAEKFELSGGAIKSIVTKAAYLAAAEDVAIGRRHLGRAIARELEKMDRLYARGELEAFMAPLH